MLYSCTSPDIRANKAVLVLNLGVHVVTLNGNFFLDAPSVHLWQYLPMWLSYPHTHGQWKLIACLVRAWVDGLGIVWRELPTWNSREEDYMEHIFDQPRQPLLYTSVINGIAEEMAGYDTGLDRYIKCDGWEGVKLTPRGNCVEDSDSICRRNSDSGGAINPTVTYH